MPNKKSPSHHSSKLQVEVLSPVNILYHGSAQAITSVNKKGKFDILPGHTSFISLIQNQIVIHDDQGQKKKFELQHGVIRCLNNDVKVYIGL